MARREVSSAPVTRQPGLHRSEEFAMQPACRASTQRNVSRPIATVEIKENANIIMKKVHESYSTERLSSQMYIVITRLLAAAARSRHIMRSLELRNILFLVQEARILFFVCFFLLLFSRSRRTMIFPSSLTGSRTLAENNAGSGEPHRDE